MTESLIASEAERLVISNLLGRPEFAKQVLPQLERDYFAGETYARVFDVMSQAAALGYELGLAGVYRFMLDAGKNNADFGLPILSELAWADSFDIPDPAPWIRKLQIKRAERKAWRVTERLKLGIEQGVAAEQFADAREQMKQVEGELSGQNFTSYGTIGDMAARNLAGLFSSGPAGVPTPFEGLNRLTNGGPRTGQFWILGARPSLGKSTLALQFALHAAAAGMPTLLVTLEMSEAEILQRIVSSKAEILYSRMMRGDLGEFERRAIAETLETVGEFPLTITDRLRTLQSVCAEIAKGAKGGPWKLVLIDYLGLIELGGRHENRNAEVSTISRRLKLIAMDSAVPVIALHQLNRSNDREDRRPALSDLRDSGTLEQDCDTCLLLDAPSLRKKSDAPADLTHLFIAKQRTGTRNVTVYLKFEPQYCRMVEA